ncbi:HECT-domain-containing protein [Hesseltinella vesiculosa]|uniref:HECT-type E3 ubiquitin transferase n=1 Tax=Hesseltinella vesiculosa TaxID=101127 RepID=A0A1X2G5J6_9FUNG|nr:HECT-domain-containing protein [Hesseltinella vesiculosa]
MKVRGAIDLAAIVSLREGSDDLTTWNQLTNVLLDAFGDLDNLSQSFLLVPHDDTCPVDKPQAQQAFQLIKTECPPFIFKRITDRVRKLIQQFIRNQKNQVRETHMNALVILFQCGVYIDVLYPNNLLTELCEFVGSIEPQMQDIFCKYLVWDPTTHALSAHIFKKHLDTFHRMIQIRLLMRSSSTSNISINADSVVMDVTRCLAMMYRLNERHRFVSFTDFYNDAVNDQLETKEDLSNYKDHKGFSFCDYAFILNPVVKADILKSESEYQMRHELQDAFFRALFQGVNSPYLVLEIRRDHLIEDALQQLEDKSIHDLKKQLRIQFVGEEGVDEGGVQKEFFQLMIRELFDSKYGMFVSNEESRLCWFNPQILAGDPDEDQRTLREFKLMGLLIGLAVYNGVILDLHFPLALYKKLMGKPTDLSDLMQLDPSLGHGLYQLLQQHDDDSASFDHHFQVDMKYYDLMKTIELKPNGGSIMMTNDTKHEFVNLYADFVLNTSITEPFEAFQLGFNLVCQDCAIKIFRPEELEQLICGSSDLDFEALEKSTVYDGGWTEDSPIIRHFWDIVHHFSYEEKKKLLFFATGSDRAPIGGLGKLQFVIAKNGGDSDRLPTAHTCYNVLLLCEYGSKEKLQDRLLTSISNAEGFGMI